MKPISFTKAHALKNDFVIVHPNAYLNNLPHLSIFLAHRNVGIGCDQVIYLKKEGGDSADNRKANVSFFNKDGSKANMCGNGMLCAALWIMKNYGTNKAILNTEKSEFGYQSNLMTDNRVKIWPVPGNKDDVQTGVLAYFDAVYVNTENHHLVLFPKCMDNINIKEQGPHFETLLHSIDPTFPKRVNVGFAHVRGDHIDLRVWERGAGETKACGSGAIAAVHAALANGFLRNRNKLIVMVHQKGGTMEVEVFLNYHLSAFIGHPHLVYNGDITVPTCLIK